jgi:3'-phosphoadenosine 5'-phosphosulfate (PAPS) 3'-phosphatase
MTAHHSKIFGIGLSKTGTTSLANALQILGYRTKDNMGVVKYAAGDLSSVDLDVVDTFEALTDTPIPSFYRELDARYPDSKFILTVRDSDGWLKSCKKQFTERFAQIQSEAHKQLFMDLYGTDIFDEERFASGLDRFIAGVRDYFKNRPRDLLIIDVAAGEGWDKLCPFLGRAVPDVPFPKANVTRVRWMAIDEVIAVATEAAQELIRRYDSHGQEAFGVARRRNAPLQSARNLLERSVLTVLGEHGAQAAIRATHKAIVRGLAQLTPGIPALSRAGPIVPHAERRAWNHFWLVDPLDGEGAFANGDGNFSIDIALIEDGRPICGVVFAPAKDTIYYAMMGKGAYRRVGGGNAEPLASSLDRMRPAATATGTSGQTVPARQAGTASSHALAMCALSTAMAGDEVAFPPSMEWQTAAAHAILTGAGLRTCESESGEDLGYNKKDLANGWIRVESSASVRT